MIFDRSSTIDKSLNSGSGRCLDIAYPAIHEHLHFSLFPNFCLPSARIAFFLKCHPPTLQVSPCRYDVVVRTPLVCEHEFFRSSQSSASSQPTNIHCYDAPVAQDSGSDEGRAEATESAAEEEDSSEIGTDAKRGVEVPSP